MATLGIDFGTSYTFIVKYDGDKLIRIGNERLYSMSTDDGDLGQDPLKSKGIRTAIGVDNGGHWVVGSFAIKKAIDEGSLLKENVCWDIKTKLRKLNELHNGNKAMGYGLTKQYTPGVYVGNLRRRNELGHLFSVVPYGYQDKFIDALDLAKEFFNQILAGYKDDSDDIQCIVCGMPSKELNMDCPDIEIYKRMLKGEVLDTINKKILNLGLDDEKLILREEPILAAVSFFKGYNGMIQPGDVVLVIDIGGGTTDFVLYEVEQNRTKKLIDSAGSTSPAGNDINDVIAQIINEKYNNVFDVNNDRNYIYSEEFSEVKEKLFYSKNSKHIEKLAKINDHGYTAEKIFEKYSQQGRRTTLNVGGQEYKIAYSFQHCQGIQGTNFNDEYGDSWDPNDVAIVGVVPHMARDTNDRQGIEGKFHDIADRVGDFLGGLQDKQYKEKISKVLFVGGGCNPSSLRDLICQKGIGLEMGDNVCKMKGRPVEVYFLEEEGDNNVTCSNAVAIGAAYEGYECEGNIGIPDIQTLQVPELWVKFKLNADEREQVRPLLGQGLKYNGTPIFIENEQIMYFPLTINVSKADVDNNGYFHFRIGRTIGNSDDKIFYPRNNKTFAYKLDFNDREIVKITIFADILTSGEVAVFVCKDAPATKNRNRYTYKYVFVARDNNRCYTFKAVSVCNNRQCKKYKLVEYGKQGKETIEGDRFSAGQYVITRNGNINGDNDTMWFGWEPTEGGMQ